jgi:hypothetical protein
MPIEGNFNPGIPMAAPYVGPGDVVSGAIFFLALRAYTVAIALAGTQTLVNVRRDSDNATVDVLVTSNGGFGLTANGSIGGINGITVSTFKGSANLFMTKLYDQTGNGHPISQTTAANQPGLSLSALGGGTLPSGSYGISGADLFLSNTSAPTVTQPLTISCVAERTGLFSAQNWIFWTEGTGPNLILLFASSANTLNLYDGNELPAATANDNVLHAIQGMWNDPGGSVYIDGVSTSMPMTGGQNIQTSLAIGDNVALGNPLEGLCPELGVWSGNFTSGQQSSMNSNQHSYWKF